MADLITLLPELREEVVSEIFDVVYQSVDDDYLGLKLLPFKNIEDTVVKYKKYFAPIGMLPSVNPKVPAPEVGGGRFEEVIMAGAPFKEKRPFDAEELTELQLARREVRFRLLDNIINETKSKSFVTAEKYIWDAFRGNINIVGRDTSFIATYDVQTTTVTASWATTTTNILADMEKAVNLIKSAGGKCDYIIMNSKTYSSTLSINNNMNDVIKYGGILLKKESIDKMVQDATDGAKLVIYDGGYYTVLPELGGTFNKYVKDDEVFFICSKGGMGLGNFILTIDSNTINQGKPKSGFWNKTVVKDEDPYGIEIVYGFTGAPALYMENWVVYIADVT